MNLEAAPFSLPPSVLAAYFREKGQIGQSPYFLKRDQNHVHGSLTLDIEAKQLVQFSILGSKIFKIILIYIIVYVIFFTENKSK